MNSKLTNIVEQFAFEGTICEIKPLGEGLINETYKVKTCETDRPDYVLQRINHHVFPDIDRVMHNIDAVTSHIRNTLAAKETTDTDDISIKIERIKQIYFFILYFKYLSHHLFCFQYIQ